MKAYMSNPDSTRQVADVFARINGYTSSQEHAALAEARRILAETEQCTELSDYYIMPPWPKGLPRPSTNGALYERVAVNVAANIGAFALLPFEREILAESLAAFIEQS